MKRRDFITLLRNAVAWPLGAKAQQPGKTWRTGFIAHGHERFYDALFEGLRELGYTEGFRAAQEKAVQWAALQRNGGMHVYITSVFLRDRRAGSD